LGTTFDLPVFPHVLKEDLQVTIVQLFLFASRGPAEDRSLWYPAKPLEILVFFFQADVVFFYIPAFPESAYRGYFNQPRPATPKEEHLFGTHPDLGRHHARPLG